MTKTIGGRLRTVGVWLFEQVILAAVLVYGMVLLLLPVRERKKRAP